MTRALALLLLLAVPAHAGATANPIPLATFALWCGALAGFVIAEIVKDACGWAGVALVAFLLGLLIVLGVALPAHAAGNAPGPATEGPYVEWVQVVDVFGPVDLMHLRRPLCSLDTPCTGPSLTAPPLAPVPVPGALGLLASAMVLMCALKGKRYV